MPDLEPYVPAGFEAFWHATTDEAHSAALDFDLDVQTEVSAPDHDVIHLKFRGITGKSRFGWIAVPKPGGKSPGFLWLPPYSRWSMLPNEYGTRPGYVSLSFNFFGESAFHREEYTPSRGYFADGVSDPKTWVFRSMFQDAVIAARILDSLPMVERGRLASCGMSQGGGISIWLGAWEPLIKAVVADMPFLGGVPWILKANVFRYPLKELTDFAFESPGNELAVRKTLAYYDTVNQATRCCVPTRVTLGLRDPAVRPEQAKAVFRALAGEKEIEEIDFGHDWHPAMVAGGKQWLDRWV